MFKASLLSVKILFAVGADAYHFYGTARFFFYALDVRFCGGGQFVKGFCARYVFFPTVKLDINGFAAFKLRNIGGEVNSRK